MLGFNARHDRAESWVRQHVGDLIEAIVADQKDAVRGFIEAGLQDGTGPQTLARQITGTMNRATGLREGGILGLTSMQTDYVIRARHELNDPARMAHYFTRQRRDRRFDKIVRDAMAAGKPVAAADIDRIANRYKDRLLALRGENIARTEAITALRAGRHEGYLQLVDSGKVAESTIIRTWRAGRDGRTRFDHVILDKTEIRGLNTPFIAADGSRMSFPGDSSLGAMAHNTINCRCNLDYQIDRRRL